MKDKKCSDYGWNHPIDPAWEYEPYDGIKGFPPKWVWLLESEMKRFCEARGALFFEVEQGKVDYQEIKSRFNWMVENIEHANTSFEILVGSRQPYDALILDLANLFKWISLGKVEGAKGLAGKVAVKIQKLSTGGSSKNGNEYEPKVSIRKICEHIQSTKFDVVLNALRDAEMCADLHESTTNPIGVLFTSVDDKAEIISYLRRGKLPDNQEEFKFKRLRDILTEIKK